VAAGGCVLLLGTSTISGWLLLLLLLLEDYTHAPPFQVLVLVRPLNARYGLC
jgi:hypothetical protein